MKNKQTCFIPVLLFLWSAIFIPGSIPLEAKTINRTAKATLTAVEMDRGDTLRFTLRNGQVRTLVLKEISADVIMTNLAKLMENQPGGATLYHFTCQVLIDGHPMKMERYVGSQESFYEPYVINGMRVWFDGVDTVEEFLKDNHGGGVPQKDARFAIADMTMRICPSTLFPMYHNPGNYIRIEDSYNADDCWLGAYNGLELHGGLDINQERGTPNFTPFAIDDHYFFTSLKDGGNNNRWRGIRTWENGDEWIVQNHHMLNLRVPEHTPIPGGTYYAEAASVRSGNHDHSHYMLKVKAPEDDLEILLDPWILFWQTFEDNRERAGETKAVMAPFTPGKTGARLRFTGEKSRSRYQKDGKGLTYYWTFGDGTVSLDNNPEHVFVRPGIYPVTLVVDDGIKRSSFTQHITIDGPAVERPSLALICNEPSFRTRPVHIMDVYGSEVRLIPNSIHFLARDSRPRPDPRTVGLVNVGMGNLQKAKSPEIRYEHGSGWLTLRLEERDNSQALKVSVDGSGLPTGVYSALVKVDCPESANGAQYFRVYLTIPTYPPAHREMRDLKQEIIDNADIRENRFYHTPYFWVAPRFKRWTEKGFGDFYLTNGGRAAEGEFARFRPDLEEGTYDVFFAEETPFDPQRRATHLLKQYPVDSLRNPVPGFKVRVYSQNGEETLWVKPTESLLIGRFKFSEGMDGYVDILSDGAVGQVLVDAIIFRKVAE